ncbi:MAG TPA: hypothetical protein VIX82_14630 [Solirubrobacteraceae bacterium]
MGIPPSYRDWVDYERRTEFMLLAGVIADYTFLWPDVRPQENLGTVPHGLEGELVRPAAKRWSALSGPLTIDKQ